MSVRVTHTASTRNRRFLRRGFTLAELLVSMTIMTILMGAMTSVVLIASHALPDGQGPLEKTTQAAILVDQIAGDLFYTTTLLAADANAVSITVADRGHGAAGPETLQYVWSGTAGDPLTHRYNSSADITLATDVHDFSLEYTRKTTPLSGPPRVLLVVDIPASPNAQDIARQTAMEGWGFTVEFVAHWASEAVFKAAEANNDVIYVAEGSDSGSLAPMLRASSRGVVNEVTNHYADIGVAQSGTFHFGTDFTILDNAHEITSSFPLGTLQIFWSDENFAITMKALSAGTRALAERSGNPTLLVLDVGGELYGGGTANGRRVCLPWAGWKTFDFNNVNADGLTLMKRSIEWAAARTSVSTVRIALQLGADPNSRVETQVQLLNQPGAP